MASEINLGGHADTLILIHWRRGWSGSRVSCELLQLQQQVSRRCLVRRGGMGAQTTDGGQSLMTLSHYMEMMCVRCV